MSPGICLTPGRGHVPRSSCGSRPAAHGAPRAGEQAGVEGPPLSGAAGSFGGWKPIPFPPTVTAVCAGQDKWLWSASTPPPAHGTGHLSVKPESTARSPSGARPETPLHTPVAGALPKCPVQSLPGQGTQCLPGCALLPDGCHRGWVLSPMGPPASCFLSGPQFPYL